MHVLVAYDIQTLVPNDQQRLARVAAICERYGERAQYSLFECHLQPAALEAMIGELLAVIHPDVDAIDIYCFDRPMPEVRTSLGRRSGTRQGGSWIIAPAPRIAGDP